MTSPWLLFFSPALGIKVSDVPKSNINCNKKFRAETRRTQTLLLSASLHETTVMVLGQHQHQISHVCEMKTAETEVERGADCGTDGFSLKHTEAFHVWTGCSGLREKLDFKQVLQKVQKVLQMVPQMFLQMVPQMFLQTSLSACSWFFRRLSRGSADVVVLRVQVLCC